MLANLFWMAMGVLAVGLIWFVSLGVKRGWAYATSAVSNWWNGTINQVKADVAALQKDVAAIKTSINLK